MVLFPTSCIPQPLQNWRTSTKLAGRMPAGTLETPPPVGAALPGWQAPPAPQHTALEGRYCRLEALRAAQHAAALYAANAPDISGHSWTYMPYGPFAQLADYQSWVEQSAASTDPLFFAIIERSSMHAAGVASYLRITPASGSIEVGHIHYSPVLARTRAATEAMYLLMQQAFQLGYRRYEWKCDALNAPSRAAALRLGFSFEGVFRQATVYKQRSRDTAWYAMIDTEWPALQAAFEHWLAPENFDAAGRQRSALSALTSAALQQRA